MIKMIYIALFSNEDQTGYGHYLILFIIYFLERLRTLCIESWFAKWSTSIYLSSHAKSLSVSQWINLHTKPIISAFCDIMNQQIMRLST